MKLANKGAKFEFILTLINLCFPDKPVILNEKVVRSPLYPNKDETVEINPDKFMFVQDSIIELML